MKSRILFIIFIFIAINAHLSAFGRKDAEQIKTQNDEWILCVTSFDISSLPHEKQIVVNVISRKIVEQLVSISYRTRISPEYTYYEGLNWASSRAAAAKAVSAKMEERSAELYRGNPSWRYRQSIARIDNDLTRLRENLNEIEKNAPNINREPVFKLTQANLGLTFPAAPEAGTENRFCAAQRADAFLAGAITDFHGRYLLSVKLYTVYTRSFVWEDSIIFSQEDIDSAVTEITQRMSIVLSGNVPAVVAITAEPEDTLLLINRSFVGRGKTDDIELPPATIIVTASAPDHESITFETVLSADERTDIKINLTPIRYTDVLIAGEEGGRVYRGALYVGNAPLTLRLPVNRLEYIEMETANSNKGTIVFLTAETSNNTPSFSVKTSVPLASGRVAKERRGYYWSWGGAWITGIAAWIAYFSYSEASAAIATTSNPSAISDFYNNDYQLMYYIHVGSVIALGAAGVYTVYRFVKYLYISNKGSTPVVSPGRY